MKWESCLAVFYQVDLPVLDDLLGMPSLPLSPNRCKGIENCPKLHNTKKTGDSWKECMKINFSCTARKTQTECITVYNIRIVQNCINEYIVMYLNKPNDVTSAQRPSSAKYFTQVIFWSFDVNGAATDASACDSDIPIWAAYGLGEKWFLRYCKNVIFWWIVNQLTFSAPQSLAPSPHIATI